jgi:hypothetical protein
MFSVRELVLVLDQRAWEFRCALLLGGHGNAVSVVTYKRPKRMFEPSRRVQIGARLGRVLHGIDTSKNQIDEFFGGKYVAGRGEVVVVELPEFSLGLAGLRRTEALVDRGKRHRICLHVFPQEGLVFFTARFRAAKVFKHRLLGGETLLVERLVREIVLIVDAHDGEVRAGACRHLLEVAQCGACNGAKEVL